MGAAEDSAEAACEKLVWSHNPEEVMRAAAVLPTSWAGSVQTELKSFGLEAEAGWPTEPGAAYLKAAVVMMAKDEGDIISHNIGWLYFIGLRRFVIIDNASEDDTAQQLAALQRSLPGIELLVVADPILRYMQAQKTTGLYRFALSLWPDLQWVFPIDADEFLIPLKGLAVLDTLSPRIDAVTIPKSVHFRNTTQQGEEPGIFFERMDLCSPLFEVPPKVALRRNPFMAIAQGNHKVQLLTRPEAYEGGFKHGLYLREYPVRSFAHFVRKVRNGGQAIHAAQTFLGHAVGGGHWLAAHDVLQTGGETALRALYERDWVRVRTGRFRFTAFRGLPNA